MILNKDFRAQKGVPDHKVAADHNDDNLDQNKSKIALKTSFSALVGDPAAVTLAINHSIFIK